MSSSFNANKFTLMHLGAINCGDAEYVSHTPANVQIYPKAITIIY